MTQPRLSRSEFRDAARTRDNDTCVIPWCTDPVDDVHHIIERSRWENGGYYLSNAASVCNHHHQYAEETMIPPHAFWRWIDVDPLTPDGLPRNINKWGTTQHERGAELETPPWTDYRDEIKYQSTRHFPFSHIGDHDDTAFRDVDTFLDIPLVTTIKLDGGNAMLVKDTDNPVRARNGKYADHQSFDLLKKLYWDETLYSTIPESLQVFGEWAYATHSIHYGCNGCCELRNQGPVLRDYFQVFGVFDMQYNVWLGWPEVEYWADQLGFPTTPVVKQAPDSDPATYEHPGELYDDLPAIAAELVRDGHEGLVTRSKFPFHYGEFTKRVGKYVRENHVPDGSTHWKHSPQKTNIVSNTSIIDQPD